jgi:hypothetical protein
MDAKITDRNKDWIRTEYAHIESGKIIQWKDGSNANYPYAFDIDDATKLKIADLNAAAYTKQTL